MPRQDNKNPPLSLSLGAFFDFRGRGGEMGMGILRRAKKVSNTVKRAKKASSIIPGVMRTAGGGIKKAGHRAVQVAKVARAVGGVVKDVTNPYKMGKVAVNAARGKGVVYPGSKYIGPGNAMNLGKGNSSADRAAYKHDQDYDKLLKKGVKPKHLYTGFGAADQRLMDRSKITTKHGLVTKSVMGLKKAAYKAGLTGKYIKD